jgi:ribokinase
MFDVIGFGAMNLDLIYHVDSLSQISGKEIELLPGKELSASSQLFSKILQRVERRGTLKSKTGGGSAANTVVALSRMGFKTGFVGKVGNDAEGDWLVDQMEAVDIRGIVFGGMSGRCLCILDSNLDRSILVDPGANDSLSSDEIDWRYATDARFVHFTSFAGEKPLRAQLALVEKIHPPVQISFDPGEVYACRGLKHVELLVKKSFIIFATESEIEMLTGLSFLEGSAILLDRGPSIIVCKRGQKGIHVTSHDQRFDLRADPAEVTDNTGAGDVFNAGFLAGLLMNRPLPDCASLGTRLAARSVTGYGRSRYPERKDLEFFSE